MSRYDGLIIPRSYSEYINKTDAATLSQALQLSGVMDAAPTENSNKAAKSGGIYNAIDAVKPVNTIAANNMHSVTSNAIAKKIQYNSSNVLVTSGNSETEVSVETTQPINNFNYLIFVLRWSDPPYIYDTRILPVGLFATANRQIIVQNIDGSRARFRYVDNTHIKCMVQNASYNSHYEVLGIL